MMGSHNMTEKQIAFQEAEKAFFEAKEAIANLDPSSSDFGHRFKCAQQETIEAETQIDRALEFASETQRKRLYSYREQVDKLKHQLELSEEFL